MLKLAQGLKYSNFTPSSPDNICGPLTVRVAAINAAKGVGHFSKEVQIPAKAPQISAKMELISIKDISLNPFKFKFSAYVTYTDIFIYSFFLNQK